MYERRDGSAYILQLKKYQESNHRVLFMCPVMRLLSARAFTAVVDVLIWQQHQQFGRNEIIINSN